MLLYNYIGRMLYSLVLVIFYYNRITKPAQPAQLDFNTALTRVKPESGKIRGLGSGRDWRFKLKLGSTLTGVVFPRVEPGQTFNSAQPARITPLGGSGNSIWKTMPTLIVSTFSLSLFHIFTFFSSLALYILIPPISYSSLSIFLQYFLSIFSYLAFPIHFLCFLF